MKEYVKEFSIEVLKTVLFVLAKVLAPTILILSKYDLYNKVSNTPFSNKVTAGAIVLALIVGSVIKLLIMARFSSAPANWFKKLLWGVFDAAPWIALALVGWWISRNIEFVILLAAWTGGTTAISYLVAPQFVIDFKQKKG